MDYDRLTDADQRQLVEGSLKEFEAKHLQACINIAANKGIPGSQTMIAELTKQRDALALGILNLRREYAALLAEPEPAAEPEPEGEILTDGIGTGTQNGRVLSVVGAEPE